MPDKKISELPSAEVVQRSSLVPVVVETGGLLITSQAEVEDLLSDATTEYKGAVKLAGDLAGTASEPRVPALLLKAPLDSPNFTGTPTVPTPVAGDATAKAANTAFVQTALSSRAPLASPTFTGTPTAPTAAAGNSSKQLANTEFVQNAIAAIPAAEFKPVETIGGQIEVALNKAYVLELRAAYAYEIRSIAIRSQSGTCIAALQINNANLSQLENISVSPTLAVVTPTTYPTVSAGQKLSLVLSANVEAKDVEFTVETKRV